MTSGDPPRKRWVKRAELPPVPKPAREPPTVIPCLECKGHWKTPANTQYGRVDLICPWCTEGGMDLKQVARWRDERKPPPLAT